jgi:FAD/FMN-containing dehydrogenase
MRRKLIWLLLLLAAVVVLAALTRPALHLARVAVQDSDPGDTWPAGVVDDASRMNRTPVREVRRAPGDLQEAERQLAELLAEARNNGWQVSIAGARHSMGGHTIYPGGIALDMLPLRGMRLDADKEMLYVQAGALWRDVLAHLDAHALSVAVMQSNNSFSVGGSISVNCHGWQHGRPPIASTVRSLRLMLADGSIIRASRTENAELFSLVLGGYGLFGVILDVELAVVPNRRYRLERFMIPTSEFLATWNERAGNRADAAMVVGRLNVMDNRFLEDALLYVFYELPADGRPLPSLRAASSTALRRYVFRGSAENEYGKRLRWEAETRWQPKLTGNIFSRNQLLNESVEVFQNRSPNSTDILHEYFVPREAFHQFVTDVQTIVRRHRGNLLNVTVRGVETDQDSFLRYADQPLLALVMLFWQERTQQADRQMQRMTRALIDAALAAGGRYYLPYRLHATPEQFHRAYPRAGDFFRLKRQYDPHELFQNQFYLNYGTTAHVGQEAD